MKPNKQDEHFQTVVVFETTKILKWEKEIATFLLFYLCVFSVFWYILVTDMYTSNCQHRQGHRRSCSRFKRLNITVSQVINNVLTQRVLWLRSDRLGIEGNRTDNLNSTKDFWTEFTVRIHPSHLSRSIIIITVTILVFYFANSSLLKYRFRDALNFSDTPKTSNVYIVAMFVTVNHE
jgi:hypothetical protein